MLCLFLVGLAARELRAAAASSLAWDAVEKSFVAKPGETEAVIPFLVTNQSGSAVQMREASTSCHCTQAVFPRRPWVLEPGTTDTLTVHVDLRGRHGGLTKTVYLDTSSGEQILVVHVQVPPPPAVMREMNRDLALADRQAVLRGDCASCHVTPTLGKTGGELFRTACLICHGSPTRATMVPDLAVAKTQRDAAYWTKWIRDGGEKTLMPAFAKENGGSLDDAQIQSLVQYLVANLATQPEAKHAR
jgi:cytochrome c553